jgi:uncharacterized protein YdeI (YjbR/CyaY-like superfamily)
MAPMAKVKTDLPQLAFKTPAAFEKWLSKNHDKSDGIKLLFYKKDSGKPSVRYPEAVEISLCYGWIDGMAKGIDEESYEQRFTPRRAKSIWSKINVERVNTLIEAGKMKAAGLQQIAAAKADGRWEAAYDSPSTSKIPEDFVTLLNKHPKAKKFFSTLNKTNTYAITWRLQTAKKPETREKRMKVILEMLKKGETFH